MSGEEALRRFHDEDVSARQSELAHLHPVMKLVALGGTLLLITAILLGVLYLFGA